MYHHNPNDKTTTIQQDNSVPTKMKNYPCFDNIIFDLACDHEFKEKPLLNLTGDQSHSTTQ